MKKFISYLLPLFILTVMILSGCKQNKVYATVVVSPEKYNEILQDKTLIKKTTKSLLKFNSEKPQTEDSVLKSIKEFENQGIKNVRKQDRKEFRNLIGDKTGIHGIIQKAYLHQRGFDDDMNGRIRNKMLHAIRLMANNVTKDKKQQKKIYQKMINETDVDNKLYHVAHNE